MSACPDPQAVDPASLDDDTRAALERVSRAIWRALLAVEHAEAEQRAREAAARREAEQRTGQSVPK